MTQEDIASRFLNMLLPELFADKKGKEERLEDSRPEAQSNERSERHGRRENRRDEPREQRAHSRRDRDDSSRRERPRFKSKFSEKRSHSSRPAFGDSTPPWERKEERPARDSSQSKPRWKKDRASSGRNSEFGARPFSAPKTSAPGTYGDQGKLKSKKFLKWGSKKERSRASRI